MDRNEKSQKIHSQDSPNKIKERPQNDRNMPKESTEASSIEYDLWKIERRAAVPFVPVEKLNKPLFVFDESGNKVRVEFLSVLTLPQAGVEDTIPTRDGSMNTIPAAIPLYEAPVQKSPDLKTKGVSTSDDSAKNNLQKETEKPSTSPEKGTNSNTNCIFCSKKKPVEDMFEAACGHFSCRSCIQLCIATEMRTLTDRAVECLSLNCEGTFPAEVISDELDSDTKEIFLSMKSYTEKYDREGGGPISTCNWCGAETLLVRSFTCEHNFCSICLRRNESDYFKELGDGAEVGCLFKECPAYTRLP